MRHRLLRHETAVLSTSHQTTRAITRCAQFTASAAATPRRNLFDALFDTLDRIDRIEGRSCVVAFSSGADTSASSPTIRR